MDVDIEVSEGHINVIGPFYLNSKAGNEEFVRFWNQFITQQVRLIMDELGDKKFATIVQKSNEIEINAIPDPLKIQIKLTAEPDKVDKTQTRLSVVGVSFSPDLSDEKVLFILGYINAAITGA
ncbi:hypothetical protein BGL34_03295 [Fructilactobacillus lindneri]|uniref:Uncharacterized protein n=2 Tax=Fructilactobacillus lindneri TaxID=53444 RepID=A0A0R2JNG3_9LACO|nr:hypothetical protein [Fructilactobacillus lindneri]ANZ57845.1 hypothetical protein AYR60_03235 [Fructilactobacillus lindneri]ANZ59114.1 hypothetical protein AYR59_03235 [Fructilactobacillus lindneri]KRN78699.1 hypothetical protein IV52_GL000976 [Fructilactobacillus lindneri DSM 20690 = JCM 11027]POG98166.1 hypothetical protein BGL31_03565 [Fructilactobacillus lindneri]POH01718.1 hypothetical protein BGL32_03865 [Fructilactobacillus lindneri]